MYKTVTVRQFKPDSEPQWYFLHWGPRNMTPNQWGQLESDGYFANMRQAQRMDDTEVVTSPTSLNLWLKNRGKPARSER
jgi:hypothetical protein